MALFGILLVILGFWPSYFGPLLDSSYSGTWIVKIHAIVFLAWMLVFLTQTLLVGSGRSKLHKRLGVYGVGLGTAMIVLGLAVSFGLVQRFLVNGEATSVLGGLWMASEPFLDITQFAILLFWAYLKRGTPSDHRRLMLLATVAVLPAATGRMGYVLGPWSMELLFLLMGGLILIQDWRNHGSISKVNMIGLLILLPRAILATVLKF
jgi:hypothetical protein